MENNRSMRALDDDMLDKVSGGINVFNLLFGDGNTGAPDREIAAPCPTPAKECFGPGGKHVYPKGSNICQYCHKAKQ